MAPDEPLSESLKLAKLNVEHQKRFSDMRTGQRLRLKLVFDRRVEGVVDFAGEEGVVIHNELTTVASADACSESIKFSWIEILEVERIG
jgi:hypothetical protein